MTSLIKKYNFSYSLRSLIISGIIALLAYMVGVGTLKIVAEKTLGSIFRNYIPAAMVSVILYSVYIFRDKSISAMIFQKSQFSLKPTTVALVLACLLGFIVPYYAGEGLLYVPVGIAIVFAYLLSSYFMLTGKRFESLIIFIMVFPFIKFIEYDFRHHLFIGSWNQYFIGPFTLGLTSVFIITLFFLYLIGTNKEKSLLISHPSSIFMGLGIWMLVILFSCLLKGDIVENLKYFIPNYFYPSLFFVLLLGSIKNRNQLYYYLSALILCVILTTLFGFYFWIQGGVKFTQLISEFGNMYLISSSPHNRAMILVLTIPLALGLLFSAVNKKNRLINLSAVFLMVVMEILTFSRSTFVGLVAGLIVFIRKWKIWFVSVIIVTMIMFASFSFLEKYILGRFINIWDVLKKPEVSIIDALSGGAIDSQRKWGYIAAIDIFKDYPIFGVGTTNWEQIYPNYGPPAIYKLASGDEVTSWIGGAHNIYLHYLATMGIIGLSALLFMFFTVFRFANKTLQIVNNMRDRYLTLGVIGSMITAIVMSTWGGFYGHSEHNYLNVIVFWSVIVTVILINRFSVQDKQELPAQ